MKVITWTMMGFLFIKMVIYPPTLQIWEELSWIIYILYSTHPSYHKLIVIIRFVFGVGIKKGFFHIKFMNKDLSHIVIVLNVYSPCKEKKTYWIQFFAPYKVQVGQVIIGWCLNYSLNNEVSGNIAKVDHLANYFLHKVEDLTNWWMWN